MRLCKLIGLVLAAGLLAACGDDGPVGTGGNGGTGGMSTGGGGSGPCVDVLDGKPAKEQIQGDCLQAFCLSGAVVTANEDTDVPDDGNECTVDACSVGKPTTTPQPKGAACTKGGSVCDGSGKCVECNEDTDCPAGNPLCDAATHTCKSIDCTNNTQDGDETDVDCGGLCPPCDDGKACGIGADCKSGVCETGVCQAPACDDGVKNGDETGVDCGGPTCPALCGPGEGCDSNADCVGGECTGMAGTCVPNCLDQTKNNQETDVDCGGGACSPCKIGQQCGDQDTSCEAGAYCDAGTCAAKKAQGEMCGGNSHCTSGHCTDAVCCGSACAGTCLSCNLPGSTGTCALIPLGQDPDNECAGNGGSDVCNGDGACAKAAGTSCASGAECASNFCTDGLCCSAPCSGLCQACTMMKTGQPDGTCAGIMMGTDPDNECAGSLACMAAGACASPLPNGAACTAAAECASGFCADGVCCNVACAGACSACTMALKGQGQDGTCGFIQTNTDPQNECAGALSCNGSGACFKGPGAACAGSAECASGFCVDGVCCNTSCTGLCKACNITGNAGNCINVPNGTDPANECAGAATCNGNGACN